MALQKESSRERNRRGCVRRRKRSTGRRFDQRPISLNAIERPRSIKNPLQPTSQSPSKESADHAPKKERLRRNPFDPDKAQQDRRRDPNLTDARIGQHFESRG